MIEQYVSAQELRRLLSALLVVVIFICIFALFAFLVVPGMRNANQPLSGPAVSPPQGESGWLDLTDYPPAKGYTLAPVDPKTVISPTPELLARGQKLFNENCVACHGTAGRGDGPAAKGLNPPPRNFSAGAGWKNGVQIEGLWKTLQEGIKGSGMVAYEYLSNKDRMAVIHYVQSLGAFDRGPEDPKKLEALAALFSSSGEVVPNRIPVAQAMSKLEEERTRAPSLPDLSSSSSLVRWSVIDPARAAQTLAGVAGWQQDTAKLAHAVVSGLPTNGFAPGVSCLDLTQWKDLQDQLSGARAP